MVYSSQEVKNLLQRISEGNRATGGLNPVGKVYGIAGCIKFLESYYLIVVTKRRQIGAICGHAIYCIEESQMITVPHSSIQSDIAFSKTELRYKKLLSSVDLTKDFFFSYTYPIMRTLQKNVTSIEGGRMPYDNMFVWNAYLTEAIRSRCKNTLWTIALVHGDFKQVRLSIYGREFVVAVISRRSRHFAGTRYLKRGVNDRGWVANDVETEQIVIDEESGLSQGRMSSVVQVRGSIPLFWSQEASRFSPKPDIILQRYDPTYQATKLHFEDLSKRYGNPIIVLNLIKTVEKRPREMMLRREFAHAVGYLNQILPRDNHLKFIHWDFHKFAKSKSANVLAVLGAVAGEALDLTGFYYSGKRAIAKKTIQLNQTSTRDSSLSDHRTISVELVKLPSNVISLNAFPNINRESYPTLPLREDSKPHFQSGVLRTNCIDCLDRTNVAQYAYGLAALGRQLHAMGLTDTPKVDPDSSIASTLMDMYQSMGDILAQQYGGSAAHNTVFTERQGKWKATTQSREFIKSIRRYYSNAYTDGEKQDAINLFLGYFKPQEGKPALWELDSDYYLHVTGIGVEPMPGTEKCPLPDGDTMEAGKTTSIQSSPEVLLNALNAGLAPIPACKQDFTRMKLTSFDKLLGTTGSTIKNVRLCSEPDTKPSSGSTFGVAPDAVEIQLKTPNWLYGQRKYDERVSATKATANDEKGSQVEPKFDEYWDADWLHDSDVEDEEVFRRYLKMVSADGDENWYGGNVIYGDVGSGVYKHYAALCQGSVLNHFENDPEIEKQFCEALSIKPDISSSGETQVEAQMEAAFEEYKTIGADLGISLSCRSLAEDPCQLTRWIIGQEKIHPRGK